MKWLYPLHLNPLLYTSTIIIPNGRLWDVKLGFLFFLKWWRGQRVPGLCSMNIVCIAYSMTITLYKLSYLTIRHNFTPEYDERSQNDSPISVTRQLAHPSTSIIRIYLILHPTIAPSYPYNTTYHNRLPQFGNYSDFTRWFKKDLLKVTRQTSPVPCPPRTTVAPT